MTYTPKTFSIGDLVGISKNSIEEHLKLYAGYVSNANSIQDTISKLSDQKENPSSELLELQRRFAFEWGGMRNHEHYFSSLSGGPVLVDKTSLLYLKIEKDFGSYTNFITLFKSIASTRGIGWTILFYDRYNDELLIQWVDEQHIGHLSDCSIILALDMWEHSYVADYKPSGKKHYIEDFFINLNWEVVEKTYLSTQI